MKTCFTIAVSRWQIAIADLQRHSEHLYELTRINVPPTYRNRRYGSQLLRMVLAEADAEGVTLRLYPFASGDLSRLALCSWYARYGFTRAVGTVYWYRAPAGHKLQMEKRQVPEQIACQ